MFVDEGTGKPIVCPFCGRRINEPCKHFVLDIDPDEHEIAGEWADDFESWREQLDRAVVKCARRGGEPPAPLKAAVDALLKHHKGLELYDESAIEDELMENTGEQWDTLIDILAKEGVRQVVGVVDRDASSSSGWFFFVAEPREALRRVERALDGLCP